MHFPRYSQKIEKQLYYYEEFSLLSKLSTKQEYTRSKTMDFGKSVVDASVIEYYD